MDIELSILQFDDNNQFWLIRAEGGKFLDDFINNEYVGIKYNRVTIGDLNELKKQKSILTSEVRPKS